MMMVSFKRSAGDNVVVILAATAPPMTVSVRLCLCLCDINVGALVRQTRRVHEEI